VAVPVIVLAIDQGPQESAYVRYRPEERTKPLLEFGKIPNEDMLRRVRGCANTDDVLAIEHIAMGGMVAGQEVFDSCMWAGRFIETFARVGRPFELIKRHVVKMNLCRSVAAKDSNIRQALIDRFSDGKGKDVAIGKKKTPGPLYGVADDVWSALAIAVTHIDREEALAADWFAPE
jgi:hypothetical protein